jgi:hypothetical protein
MSLDIDLHKVREVLLPDGKWHKVTEFWIDEFGHDVQLGDGSLPERGATWREPDRVVFCPLTAIQAVAYVVASRSV